MSRLNIEGLSVGDIVHVSQTLVVTDKQDPDGVNVGWARAEDVQTGEWHYIGGHDRQDTRRIEMVKKAAPPKPKVGDVIQSREGLVDLPELAVVIASTNRPMIVTRKGTVAVGGSGDPKFFEHGDDSVFTTEPYTVIYLP